MFMRKTRKSVKRHKNNTRKQVKLFVKLQCSPNPDKHKNDFSCFSDADLYKLRDLWNARHPDNSIKSNDKKVIWLSLKDNMKSVCNKESCWLKQNFTSSKLKKVLQDSFAPESPKEWIKKPNDWLSSLDILQVMKQYEKAYKCFDFIGPSPIDFDTRKLHGECVCEELCHFNLKNQIKKRKTKIGVSFNLDPHYLGGSHWVSLFINIKTKSIFYFDSAGEAIPKRIMKFVDMVSKQGANMNPPIIFNFDQNYPVEHQYGDTECGIYSLYFIAHLLEDKATEQYFKTHILSDKYMSKFRKIYFNERL